MRMGPRAFTLVALCCTAAAAGLTGCGGPVRDGYAAAGAVAPGPERVAGDNVAPQDPVEFQPLSTASAAGGSPSAVRTSPGAPQAQAPAGSARGGATTTAPGAPPPPSTAPGAGPAAPPDTGTPGTPGTPPGTTPPGTTPGTTPPPASTPARLTLGPLTRAPAADRWCERVTVGFTNSGSTAARSGTVGFETHVIGALGIDWATITTTQPLPAPVPGGTTRTQTYTVCVESWRVPLGMHVETRRATATWS
ncbi:hypothetical protein ABZ128_02125 [Streptomyces sp. NPDC006326]|uniref:hypothetical protein n=1 Tax=Streptomyces sp. NPDC006326 TaxID=3156752 RepID=UPI0033ACF27D